MEEVREAMEEKKRKRNRLRTKVKESDKPKGDGGRERWREGEKVEKACASKDMPRCVKMGERKEPE